MKILQKAFITTIFVNLFIIGNLAAQAPFITTWKTNSIGFSESNSTSIIIPTEGGGYNYDVDWNGDGIYDEFGLTGDAAHDYGVAGTYTVAIKGAFPRIHTDPYPQVTDTRKLTSIEQWGDIEWTSMEGAFSGTFNLVYNATDAPDLSNVTNMSRMFSSSDFNGDISNWDVSNVTDMSWMFYNANLFNCDLTAWDVSNVTDMNNMFRGISSFSNDISNWDISTWDVSSVVDMSDMFSDNYFNGDISNWDVSNVTDMSRMFHISYNFNGDISNWDIGNAVDMGYMFSESNFSGDISDWNVSNVTNMEAMFSLCPFNGDINTWDVSNVINMNAMFSFSSFNGDINNWDVSNVTNMWGMFRGTSFNANISDWDVSNVTDMSYMFRDNSAFNGDISNWNPASVTTMAFMFSGASSFNSDISNWNISSVTNMLRMFWEATYFNGDLSNWDVSNATYMEGMFYDAYFFDSNLSNWDVANVTNMEGMFHNTFSFDSNLGNWNIGNVNNMADMLNGSGLSTTNYDNTLIGWASQNVQSNLSLGDVFPLKYCDGETARNILINTYGWNISEDALDCTSVLCEPPSNINVEVTDATTALFSWDAISGATLYQVKYRIKGTTPWLTSGTSNTQRNVPNLTPKKYYQYKIRTQCADGSWSDFSEVELFYTSACDAPTGIASIYLDNTRMRIRWDNHPNEIKAKVRYREVGTSTWYTQNSAAGQNFMYINNLTPNATYQYRVRSNCNGNDWSEYSGSYFHDLMTPRLGQEATISANTKIYPNPTRNLLNIEFESQDEEINMAISNHLGKIIYTKSESYPKGIQTENIDMSSFANGYYFITIQNGERKETFKFVKIK